MWLLARCSAVVATGIEGIHSADASDDDERREADEDGVLFPAVVQSGTDVVISVTASEASRLDAWFDWNRDGDWTDTGEQMLDSVVLGPGPNSLAMTVPGGFTADSMVFARFRISTSGNLEPTGFAADGEVEDYQVPIRKQGWLELTADADSLSEQGGVLTATVSRLGTDTSESLTITLTNNDPSELLIPASVLIPAGQTQATFAVQSVDDSLLDGTVLASVRPVQPGLSGCDLMSSRFESWILRR